MARRRQPLVTQHLESVSREVLRAFLLKLAEGLVGATTRVGDANR